MQLHRLAVPTGYGQTEFVALDRFALPGNQRVAHFNGADIPQDRLGRHLVLSRDTKVPLQVADPQHQLRNRGGPRIDLDSEEVLGRDACGR